ncbi:MAG: putative nucleic acid-binding protein, contains PIN domain [Candidatus Methanocomedens sp.]|nr:MAG: putative nucleic acid-binding protein, contains PIN domain [ANME-2 cluster archaeon]
MTVADTGILIWLARYNKLNLLKDLYGKIDIPAKVFEEAVTAGKFNGYPDAEIIESAVINEDIIVKNTGVSQKVDEMEKVFNCKLGMGEREAITLALKTGSLLLINDEEASTIAEFLCVKTKGVLFILLKSVKLGLLKKNESLAIFQQMLEDGFWLAPTTAVEFEKILFEL